MNENGFGRHTAADLISTEVDGFASNRPVRATAATLLVRAFVIHGSHQEAGKEIAAPELDGPQQAPSRERELLEECAWKHGGRCEPIASRRIMMKCREMEASP